MPGWRPKWRRKNGRSGIPARRILWRGRSFGPRAIVTQGWVTYVADAGKTERNRRSGIPARRTLWRGRSFGLWEPAFRDSDTKYTTTQDDLAESRNASFGLKRGRLLEAGPHQCDEDQGHEGENSKLDDHPAREPPADALLGQASEEIEDKQ